MKEAIWSPEAVEDANGYSVEIEQDNPVAALDWLAKAERLANSAASHPRIGRVVPEFGKEAIRELFFHSHRLIYRVKKSGAVEVARIWHASMLLHKSDLGEEE